MMSQRRMRNWTLIWRKRFSCHLFVVSPDNYHIFVVKFNVDQVNDTHFGFASENRREARLGLIRLGAGRAILMDIVVGQVGGREREGGLKQVVV